MFGIALTIRPTGGLTFRRMPSSIVHISTYPFAPPTTVAGWLRRLMLLREGIYPETAVKNPPFYSLPNSYQVLGAHPLVSSAENRQLIAEQLIHRTRRHGPMYQSKHVAFSKLHREKANEGNYEKLQLHTWEYLLTNEMRGFVLHAERAPLEALRDLVNFGCKFGKEGYAYLEAVSDVRPLERHAQTAMPSTLVPAEQLIGQPSRLYALYRYQFGKGGGERLDRPNPTPIDGFIPFWAGLPENPIMLDYWTDGAEWFLPVALTEVLYGTA